MWPPPDRPAVDAAVWKGILSGLVITGAVGGLILFALGKL
jgi:hypothetical protein